MTLTDRQRRNLRQQERRAERKAQGLCPHCGNPAYHGRLLCQPCGLRQAELWRARHGAVTTQVTPYKPEYREKCLRVAGLPAGADESAQTWASEHFELWAEPADTSYMHIRGALEGEPDDDKPILIQPCAPFWDRLGRLTSFEDYVIEHIDRQRALRRAPS